MAVPFDTDPLGDVGLGLNDWGVGRNLNWQQCLYAPHSGDCLIQLVEDGLWYFLAGSRAGQHTFGKGVPPIDTSDMPGPFTLTSAEEALATYVLCGGELPLTCVTVDTQPDGN